MGGARREAIGRGESISEAAHDAKQIAIEAGVDTRYLTQAVSKAIDEALEATQPIAVAQLTPDNCGASQIACNIVNNTFLSLDGFEAMRKQMAGTDYTAEQFGAELARIADREMAGMLNALSAMIEPMAGVDADEYVPETAQRIKDARAALATGKEQPHPKGWDSVEA